MILSSSKGSSVPEDAPGTNAVPLEVVFVLCLQFFLYQCGLPESRYDSVRIGSKLGHHTEPVKAEHLDKVSELRFVLFDLGSSTPWCSPTTQFAIGAVAPTALFSGSSRPSDARQTETVVQMPVFALGHAASPETKHLCRKHCESRPISTDL